MFLAAWAGVAKLREPATQVKQAIWDCDPALARPIVELTQQIEALDPERADPTYGPTPIEHMLDYVPRTLEAKVRAAATDEEKRSMLQQWWREQPRPFHPIDFLDRLLDNERRWRRITAARTLERLGIGLLVNEETGELDAAAVERWRRSRQAGEGSASPIETDQDETSDPKK